MIQRGKHTLFNPIVSKLTNNVGSFDIETRRDAMAHRYYFHATINRSLYDDCLHYLHQEFHLSPNTIVKELLLRVDLINNLTSDKTTTAELRKLYPFYNWQSKLL